MACTSFKDFSANLTPITFSPGKVSGDVMNVTIRISEDGEIEPDEFFTLKLQTDMLLTDLVSPAIADITILSTDGNSYMLWVHSYVGVKV